MLDTKANPPDPAEQPSPPRTWYDDIADAYLLVITGLTVTAAGALVVGLLVGLGANSLTVVGVLAGGVALSRVIRRLVDADRQIDRIVVDELHTAVRR